MPTWLRCSECREKYYTARNIFDIDSDKTCENCGGRLKKIYREIDHVLEEGRPIAIEQEDTGERAGFEIKEIHSESLDIKVRQVDFKRLPDIEADNFEISFAAPGSHNGIFKSEVEIKKTYDTDESGPPVIKAEKPDCFVYHPQEAESI